MADSNGEYRPLSTADATSARQRALNHLVNVVDRVTDGRPVGPIARQLLSTALAQYESERSAIARSGQ